MPRLLLSDDSVTVQRLIALTFAAENIAVTAVSDGDQAIARIASDRPDIVLAGLSTPKRSGYDVAAFVRSKPEFASIPVLLLAGAFEPVDQVRAAQVRCDGVLVKPLQPQQVVAKVRELIAQGGASATVSEAAAPRAPAGAQPPRGQGESLDDYFAELDAAFAHRSGPVTPSRSVDAGVVPTLESVLTEPSSAPGTPVVVTDAVVDEVTRRVVERLGTAALREVVADVVAGVAERLILEEIARIRSK